MAELKEKLPVHEAVHVIDSKTIYKTQKWWKAVVLANMFGHDKIMVYLWRVDEKTGKWKRKQKLGVNNEKDWTATKGAIDEFIPRLGTIQ